MKVYVVGENKHYANFINNAELVDNIKEADIVIFTGGEDVDPSLYGEKKYEFTYSNISRDLIEQGKWNQISENQLVIGICRGSQFVCVMNGGKLVQDCSGHGIGHTHVISDGKVGYDITSTHHQMQYPYNLDKKDYTVLYVAHPSRSNYYSGSGIDPEVLRNLGEPEIVKYHKKGNPVCLAIQGHPEYMREDAPVVKMLNDLITNTLQTIKK